MKKVLHIVSLDVPYPADYGGVFDLFYKIKYLSEAGIEIILHCFEYGRGEQDVLKKFCKEVFYYPRKKAFSLSVPYIVYSRRNQALLDRLNADDHPVLLEGIHTSWYLFNNELKKSNVWVRLHNVEFQYYRNLARNEHRVWKKIYFLIESRLLHRYEKALASRAKFLAVTGQDAETYRKMGATAVHYFPVFMQRQEIRSQPGSGLYCLYHGNLSVSENEQAVLYLATKVFSRIAVPFVVAGKHPGSAIRKVCSKYNVTLIADPDEQAMDELIRGAHIHVLPSFNKTGLKIKLIQALFNGRFVLTNQQAISDAYLQETCITASGAEEICEDVLKLMQLNFPDIEVEKRRRVLLKEFDSAGNAIRLIQILFNSTSL